MITQVLHPDKFRIVQINHKDELMPNLELFLNSTEYTYGIIGQPGLGKSTSVIKYLKDKGKKFVYVAATKPVANQLGARFNLPVIHAESDDTKADQCITIYDHITDFIDFANPDKDLVVIVDECHNLILSRSTKFRYAAIRLVETFRKYFTKVIYLTATPIDYNAYGDDFVFIVFEDNADPVEMYAVPFGTHSEVHDIAEIASFEFKTNNLPVLIYLQSLGKNLSELKSYLKQLGIKSLSVYNSQQNVWETENFVSQESFIETGLVSADVMVTTYADGFSLMNKNFCFIACNSANYHTVYQAMNRLRLGCVRYYYMTNAYKNGEDHQTVYDRCFTEAKQQTESQVEMIMKILNPSDRLVYLESKRLTTIDLEGKLILPEIARLAVDLQHKDFKENFYGLKTAFNSYKVKLVHLKRFPNRSELKFTTESMTQILDFIFFSLENKQIIPLVWPYREELEKVTKLQKYLSDPEIKSFMYGEYLKRQSSFEELYKRLQLKDNALDSQLKLRLTNSLEAKKYTSAELEDLVNQECMAIGYRYKESVQSLLRGLGFKVKVSSQHIGYKEGKKITQKVLTVV